MNISLSSTLKSNITAITAAQYSVRLSVYSKLLALAVFFLIFMGALVKSNDAGLSVPDWPSTFGENMFLYPPSKWTGGVFYEHSHRLVASFVGLLTLIMTAWLFFSESRPWVRYLGYTTLLAVVLQGLLGGVTVLYGLPPSVSIAHGVLAQTFLILVICMAYSQSKEYFQAIQSKENITSSLFTTALIALSLIYLQLILGAILRHTGSGLAIPDFPTMGGEILPYFDKSLLASINETRFFMGLRSVNLSQVYINFFHRIGAVIVTLGLLNLFFKCRQLSTSKLVKESSRRVLIVLLAQWTLGMYTIWTVRDPTITSLHVVMGAILLGFCTILTLRTRFLETS
ncbi:MAG: COX15/CtaA family protein [bacterium]|nr:COX15/CtaA family protein [bacterium]